MTMISLEKRSWYSSLRPRRRPPRKVLVSIISIAFICFYHFSNDEDTIGRSLQYDGSNTSTRCTEYATDPVRFLQNSAAAAQGQENSASNAQTAEEKEKGCTHTPYVLIGDILITMPPLVSMSERLQPINYGEPSHIQLCQAFLDRSDAVLAAEADQSIAIQNGNAPAEAGGGNQVNIQRDLNEGGAIGTFRVEEDGALCKDWQAPHYSTLSVYASSLIAAVGKPLGLRYQHNCRNYIAKMHNDPDRHYDYTPVQTLLPENLISTSDAEKVDPEVLKHLCMRCIADFKNESVVTPDDMSGVTRHCLIMPDGDRAQDLLAAGKEIPLTSILPSIIDRLRHTADDWIVTTSYIKHEDISGVIIAVDER